VRVVEPTGCIVGGQCAERGFAVAPSPTISIFVVAVLLLLAQRYAAALDLVDHSIAVVIDVVADLGHFRPDRGVGIVAIVNGDRIVVDFPGRRVEVAALFAQRAIVIVVAAAVVVDGVFFS
jgi:hypothetical protein